MDTITIGNHRWMARFEDSTAQTSRRNCGVLLEEVAIGRRRRQVHGAKAQTLSIGWVTIGVNAEATLADVMSGEANKRRGATENIILNL